MYKIVFTKQALKQLLKIPQKNRKLILSKISMLESNVDVRSNIKKLTGFDDYYRLRVGDYRVVFKKIDRVLVIEIIKIGHRKEVYQ